MDDTERQLAQQGDSEPKLTESEIIDFKKELLGPFLLDSVASAYALENVPDKENESDEQRHARTVRYAAQVGVILGQNVMRAGAEWESGVPQPVDFLPHLRLQGALQRSIQIPRELVTVSDDELPVEWREWIDGLKPNPYLTDADIQLLQANGYSVLYKPQ